MLGRTILIADDEPHLTHILAYNLQRAGAIVHVAGNGLDCMEQAAALIPDLIVSDYQMPVLDGLQACIRLKAHARTQSIPVIMLTARGHRLTESELRQTNIKRLLPKPFSARQLLAAIDEVLTEVSTGAKAA